MVLDSPARSLRILYCRNVVANGKKCIFRHTQLVFFQPVIKIGPGIIFNHDYLYSIEFFFSIKNYSVIVDFYD